MAANYINAAKNAEYQRLGFGIKRIIKKINSKNLSGYQYKVMNFPDDFTFCTEHYKKIFLYPYFDEPNPIKENIRKQELYTISSDTSSNYKQIIFQTNDFVIQFLKRCLEENREVRVYFIYIVCMRYESESKNVVEKYIAITNYGSALEKYRNMQGIFLYFIRGFSILRIENFWLRRSQKRSKIYVNNCKSFHDLPLFSYIFQNGYFILMRKLSNHQL